MKKLLPLVLVFFLVTVPAYADIVLPSNLTIIKADAFAGDTALQGELVIPEGVMVIEDSAFRDCTGLTGVTLPQTVKTIGDSAFAGNTGLQANLLFLRV